MKRREIISKACAVASFCAVLPACSGLGSGGNNGPGEGAGSGSGKGAGSGVGDGMTLDGAVSLGAPGFESLGSAVICNPDELVPPHVYVRRVKSILTGLAPTAEEMTAVQEDPDALRGLVTNWIETDEYRAKRRTFFTETFQQNNWIDLDLNELIENFEVDVPLRYSLTEVIARTAEYIIDEGKPFNEIASTDTWVMNTQVMGFLVSADTTSNNQIANEVSIYHNPVTVNGTDLDANTPLSVQIANKHLYSPVDFDAHCSDPYPVDSQPKLTTALLSPSQGYVVFCNRRRFRLPTFLGTALNDWRPVRMVQRTEGGPAFQMYDSVGLAAAEELPLWVPRAGFFSSPTFLARWRTNADNSFRVTTNQSLIVGLGIAFEETDVSTPLGDDGLAADHAAPDTACYSCHKNLDPMRNYFARVFHPDRQQTIMPSMIPEDSQPSFSFQGHSGEGETLADFGRHIGEHPAFASAWVQKLCAYANSGPCPISDPEFQRIVTAFADDFDYQAMIVDLFSSPLVTGSDCNGGLGSPGIVASVSRKAHLCTHVTNRLGIEGLEDACNVTNSATALSSSFPADSWNRGADAASQPTEPSLFLAASGAEWCSGLATRVVNSNNSPFDSGDIEASVDAIVTRVMAVPTSDPRFAPLQALLNEHVAESAAAGANPAQQLRSAFQLACESPLVFGMDF